MFTNGLDRIFKRSSQLLLFFRPEFDRSVQNPFVSFQHCFLIFKIFGTLNHDEVSPITGLHQLETALLIPDDSLLHFSHTKNSFY